MSEPVMDSIVEIQVLAAEIVKALDNPRVLKWTTWDSFAGRQIHHDRGLSREEIVSEILQQHILRQHAKTYDRFQPAS